MPQSYDSKKLKSGYFNHHVIYIIYKAIVTTKNEIKQFVRSIVAPSKTRWYGHVRDFKVHKKTALNCQNTF